jgi:hypothetical protein
MKALPDTQFIQFGPFLCGFLKEIAQDRLFADLRLIELSTDFAAIHDIATVREMKYLR